MHETLYRKYRPQKFSEVRGQKEVVEVLSGAIKNSKFSHAYLFAGSRGTGKTSVARIFAKEIGTTNTDLYEIDAASNRGIDEVRELRNAVSAMPYESSYKVYIIDEVHMLTTPAFNALLKTLEEPPSHVVFILATTELDKLPETIISRCETHSFKRPSSNDLKDMVRDVAKSEGYKIDASSDDLIALLGDGSFRDTLGVLQKVMHSVGGKEIKRDEVERITGAPRGEMVNDFVEALNSKEPTAGLKSLNEAVSKNINMKFFLSLVLEKVRAVLILRNAPDMEGSLKEEFTDEDMEKIANWAESKNINSNTLRRLLEAEREVSFSHLPHVPLELVLVEGAEEKEDIQASLLK